MSSSRSGQWIPSPRPIRRHLDRSASDPLFSLGYHPNGTEIERPSLRRTVSVSSLIATSVARGAVTSFAEELIPRLHQLLTVTDDQLLNPASFNRTKTATVG